MASGTWINGHGFTAAASWTPTAAAYSGNDVMSTVQELLFKDRAGSPCNGGEIILTNARLLVAHTALIAGETNYYLALYNTTPPTALADNDAFDVPAANRSAFLARIDLGTPADIGSTLAVLTVGLDLQLTIPEGGNLYAHLITAGAFTATAAARSVWLKGYAL